MTKKHFIAIAAIFASRTPFGDPHIESVARDEARLLAEDMADYFKSINPNFDSDRFMTACGF